MVEGGERGFFNGFFILVGPGILGLALGFSPLVSNPLSLLMWVVDWFPVQVNPFSG